MSVFLGTTFDSADNEKVPMPSMFTLYPSSRHSVSCCDRAMMAAVMSAVDSEQPAAICLHNVWVSTGFVDFVSISSSLLFSMKYETSLEGLKKQTFYNNVRLNDYSPADGYLDGIEVVKGDYKEIFERFKNEKNVLWLVDPPYLSTDCTTYNNLYWKLGDYLDVLRVLQGTSYVYFTSNKSSIVELCEWLGDGRVTANPFIGAEKITVKENMNYNTSYLDIMMYKRKEAV